MSPKLHKSMKRQKDIEALFEVAESQLQEIKSEYEKSLNDKEVKPRLKILIKNYLENLRSVLDYIAHDIHDHYVHCGKGHTIYFPLRNDPQKFLDAVQRYFHVLQNTAPCAFSFLEKYQVFTDSGNEILLKMINLVNRKKHDQLTPQTREEIPRVEVSGGSGSVSWDPRAVRFGSGLSIIGVPVDLVDRYPFSTRIVGVSIMGVPVDPSTQMPLPNPSIQVKKIIWVNFTFNEIGEPVFPFLDNILKKCHRVFEDYKVMP